MEIEPPAVTIVWACRHGVDAYAAAGRGVEVPRPKCPACGRSMIFWSGYWRFTRAEAGRCWVRRARCTSCVVSHALLPSFALVRRLDEVRVVGRALAGVVSGRGMRPLARELAVPHETLRGWRRRYRTRSPTLAAGFAALAVALGGMGPELSAQPERAALEALGAAWWQAQRRFGEEVPAVFEFASVVSGGELLGTTTSPPWAGLGGTALMPPVPVEP
jgi:transposase-like protein